MWSVSTIFCEIFNPSPLAPWQPLARQSVCWAYSWCSCRPQHEPIRSKWTKMSTVVQALQAKSSDFTHSLIKFWKWIMWKRCHRHPRHIADTTTTLFPLTNTVWNQPDTLFPHPPRSVRTQKQRSLHHSVWSNARNAVSYLFFFGNMQSSCHKSLAHFSVAIMTPFLASNRQELP